jgi:outer membrane protein assembly factor BamA
MSKRLLWFICFIPLPHLLLGQQCAPPVKFAQTLKAPIGQVTFLNDELLSQDTEAELVKQIRNNAVTLTAVETDMSSIAEEAAERARAAYQDEGYFKAEVNAKALPIVTDKHLYDIVIQILTVGKQYRLEDLNIAKATSFPTQQLRDLFPIQRGEIFSREKIAAGLEALRRLYGSQGYINYTGVPDTEFDDDKATANLNINVDEGRQFLLRSVEALGVDSDTRLE